MMEFPGKILANNTSWWDDVMYRHDDDGRLRYSASYLDGSVKFHDFALGKEVYNDYTTIPE